MFATQALCIIISAISFISSNRPPTAGCTCNLNEHDTISGKQTTIQERSCAQAQITAEISVGELVDKITILEIKSERINDPAKHCNVMTELAALQNAFAQYAIGTEELTELHAALKAANLALWDVEDLIRDKEREKEFDDAFIQLARSVYLYNDERCRIKRVINETCGSRLIEEKSYKPYA